MRPSLSLNTSYQTGDTASLASDARYRYARDNLLDSQFSNLIFSDSRRATYREGSFSLMAQTTLTAGLTDIDETLIVCPQPEVELSEFRIKSTDQGKLKTIEAVPISFTDLTMAQQTVFMLMEGNHSFVTRVINNGEAIVPVELIPAEEYIRYGCEDLVAGHLEELKLNAGRLPQFVETISD